VRWTSRDPILPPPSGLGPRLARGVVVVGGDPVTALDQASGANLGEARLPPPAHLLLGPELELWAMAADGLVAAARLSGRLGIL